MDALRSERRTKKFSSGKFPPHDRGLEIFLEDDLQQLIVVSSRAFPASPELADASRGLFGTDGEVRRFAEIAVTARPELDEKARLTGARTNETLGCDDDALDANGAATDVSGLHGAWRRGGFLGSKDGSLSQAGSGFFGGCISSSMCFSFAYARFSALLNPPR